MYSYACMLLDGEGVEADKKEAINYFKMAADKGHQKAMEEYTRLTTSKCCYLI